MKVSLEDCVAKCDNILWRVLDGEVVLMTDDGLQIHAFNRVGSYIWELVNGVAKVRDIAASVFEKFEVDEVTAREDTLEFVHELVDKGLACIRD